MDHKLVVLLALFFFLTTSCQEEDSIDRTPIRITEELTITELQNGYEHGDFTVKEVLDYYRTRIESLDRNGPELKSILILNPHADEQAEILMKSKERGPLYGVPVILKDNIDTKDSMPTTAGSVVLSHHFAKKDAPLVQQLKKAGALILGKANLSEWANFHSDLSSSGWSALGGQTKNPYKLDHNPCGSSAGSGVAVAANLCMIAIGTETNGSIVCPSNNNGIVGIKPTVGLISRNGIIPISHTQDTPGPMARTLEDAVRTLEVMTASDPEDSATQTMDRYVEKAYTSHLIRGGLQGKRIGYYKKPLRNKETPLIAKMDNILTLIEDMGAEIVEVDSILHPRTEYLSYVVMQYEFKHGINQYLKTVDDDLQVSNLSEAVVMILADSTEMKFDHQLMQRSDLRGELSEEEYQTSLDSILLLSRDQGIDRVMNAFDLDAIIAPTGGPAWLTDHEKGDAYEIYSSSPAAIAGYPNITIPMGFIGKLPVGLSFFGKAWSEGKLIEMAYDFEQVTKQRKPPKYLP